mmetsp:Transcript_113214/g.365829  ORF Transcript_113214/g.365829 Transcript_113214/m.365829 type:complete len:440 (+) Transcript_113214:548-1867(+)
MSSMSHDFTISSSVIEKPMFRISVMTNSFLIIVSNSSLSKTPLPSASAFVKASRKNSMNALALSSAWRTSCSFRSVVAATMLSEATAVSTEIMVHDTKVMKTTKNMHQAGLTEIRGSAMFIQSSCVLTRKSVKRDVGTSRKYSRISRQGSSPASPSSSMGASPWPSSRVRTIAEQIMKMPRNVKIQIMVLNISTNACTKAISLGKIFTALNIRSNLDKRRNRNKEEWPLAVVRPAVNSNGSIHESTMPSTTFTVSKMDQAVSLVKKNTMPRCKIRRTISARKVTTKKLSKTTQPVQLGLSVSPASTRTFAPMIKPMNIWNLSSSTKLSAGHALSSLSKAGGRMRARPSLLPPPVTRPRPNSSPTTGTSTATASPSSASHSLMNASSPSLGACNALPFCEPRMPGTTSRAPGMDGSVDAVEKVLARTRDCSLAWQATTIA